MSRKTGSGTAVTACLLIIGNEILSGRTQDRNVAFIGQGLNDLGIRLMEVRVIPDVEAVIDLGVDPEAVLSGRHRHQLP